MGGRNVMTYEEALSYVEAANQYVGAFGLDSTIELLKRLGNPEKRLKFIHIGGTNGKGSTAAYISTILAQAGCRVGRYISPTIFEYRERIQITKRQAEKIDTNYITEEAVAKHITSIQGAITRMQNEGLAHPTPFELETAMAFLEFADQACDIVVLEVGLGGRLDATNVIQNVECAVLTSISRDHMQFLGDTLEKITLEKAGIIKPACAVVAYDFPLAATKEQKKENKIIPVIEQVCKQQNASLKNADFNQIREERHSLEGIFFSYKQYKDLFTPILGENQVKNAALAVEVIESLQEKGYAISQKDIYEGIKQTVWAGRFDVIQKEPLYIVDGAHNEDAAHSLAKSIEIYLKGKKLLYIMGVLADKEYDAILQQVAYYAKEIITITPNNERALPSKELCQIAKQYCSNVKEGGTIEQALNLAKTKEKEYDAVLIFGSLYYLEQVYAYFAKR